MYIIYIYSIILYVHVPCCGRWHIPYVWVKQRCLLIFSYFSSIGFPSRWSLPSNHAGWWFQPLWKILVNWDYYSHILWKKNVPNHQPVIISKRNQGFSHLEPKNSAVFNVLEPFLGVKSWKVNCPNPLHTQGFGRPSKSWIWLLWNALATQPICTIELSFCVGFPCSILMAKIHNQLWLLNRFYDIPIFARETQQFRCCQN